jgi:hypothetical protein
MGGGRYLRGRGAGDGEERREPVFKATRDADWIYRSQVDLKISVRYLDF